MNHKTDQNYLRKLSLVLNLHAGHDLYVVTLKRAVKNKKKNANAVKLCNVLKPDV